MTTTTYDFDTLPERHNTDSAKWAMLYDNGEWIDMPPNVLPMWVADMDFRSPEPILRALHERVDHGVFGYGIPTNALKEAVCERMQTRYQWTISPDDIIFMPGLVSGLNVVARAIGAPLFPTDQKNGILMNIPIYQPFLSAPAGHGLQRQEAEMRLVKTGRRLRYEIDFDAFERAFTPQTALVMLCNPHNPVGRAYSRAELEQFAEICLKHDALLCSDEIHCDLMLDGARHIPTASLSPEIAHNTITLMAPSKTFNVPGLGSAFAIVPNPDLRARLHKAEEGIVPHPNVLGLTAMLAAYRDCQPWLDALLAYLTANRDYVVNYVEQHFPGVSITCPEATYLAWLDFREVPLPDTAYQFFLNEAQVALVDGKGYGSNGEGFARINFGCPRSMLTEALERMRAALERL